jgi:prepilin-type N-terminal cleavage/methylation domain-containing protein
VRRRRGFTLLEVLAAATVAAIVLFLTAQVMVAAMNGKERLHATTQDMAAVRRAYDQIARDLHSSIVPPDDSGLQFGLSASDASQGTNVLQFAAIVSEPMLTGRQSNETALVQYSIADDPRTNVPTLWRYETAYPVPAGGSGSTSTDGTDTRALPLLPNVVGASYLFYSETDQSWIESWDGQTGLPSAIRIDLLFQDPSNKNAQPRQESWVFQVPAAKAANEQAAATAEAQDAAANGTTTTTTPNAGAAGGTR